MDLVRSNEVQKHGSVRADRDETGSARAAEIELARFGNLLTEWPREMEYSKLMLTFQPG